MYTSPPIPLTGDYHRFLKELAARSVSNDIPESPGWTRKDTVLFHFSLLKCTRLMYIVVLILKGTTYGYRMEQN